MPKSKRITQAQIARAIGEPSAFVADPDDHVHGVDHVSPSTAIIAFGPFRPQARRVIARDTASGRQQLSGKAAELGHGYPPAKRPLLDLAARRRACMAAHPAGKALAHA